MDRILSKTLQLSDKPDTNNDATHHSESLYQRASDTRSRVCVGL